MKKINKNSIIIALVVSFALGVTGPLFARAAGPAAVNLGSAGNFAVLAKTGISTTGSTSIVGNIGVSPAAASYLTGFGLTMDTSNTFSTSALVTGKIYATDYTAPTPTTMTTAISDMQTAYTDGAGRTNPTETEMGAGNIGGDTLVPGLYKWSTNVTIPTDMTLSGGPNDVWIFQIAGNLVMSSATHIILSGGAQASNVFWIVAGQTIIGTTAVFNGNILDQTTIVLNTGATLNGRALAQAAVTLDSNTVTAPTSVVSSSAIVATSTTMSTTTATSTSNSNSTATSTSTANSTSTYTATPVVVPTSIQSSSTSSGTALNTALQIRLNGLLTTLHSLQAQHAAQQNSSTNTTTTLQGQLNGLLETFHSLQAQYAAQQGFSTTASAFGQQVRGIAVNLEKGVHGDNVAILQRFLISQNKGPAAQSLAKVGATDYFGGLTRAALAEFQAKVGISPALGNFGAITRAYISTH